jgi:hypothetical protein
MRKRENKGKKVLAPNLEPQAPKQPPGHNFVIGSLVLLAGMVFLASSQSEEREDAVDAEGSVSREEVAAIERSFFEALQQRPSEAELHFQLVSFFLRIKIASKWASVCCSGWPVQLPMQYVCC